MPRKDTPKTPAYADNFIGPREPHFLTLIPFPGFYGSHLEGDVDSHMEQEAEHYAEKEKGGYQGTEYPECKQPEHARIDQSEFSELLFTHMDFQKLHRLIAESYADAFQHQLSELVGFPLEMRFESMDSPQFYNFETDCCFMHIPVRTARKLVRHILRTKAGRDALRERITERHSSRSGFHSWYSTDTGEWAARARNFLRGEGDMDHNHFQTFLEAAIRLDHDRQGGTSRRDPLHDFEMDVYYAYAECDGIYHEWDQSMDWDAFDKACQELRAEKDEEFRAENPEAEVPNLPCTNTPDMFNAKPNTATQ